MASSRRTYDTEMITLRQIFAYNTNNSVIPASRVLATDGRGGTTWAIPSTLPGIPAFNEVIANTSSIVADLSYNKLILSTGDGLGMVKNMASNEIRFYSKAFTQINVTGGNTLLGYSNNTATPVLTMEGKGGIRVSSDPLTNTLFIQGVPTAISTAAYAFGQINVISNASTFTLGAINNSNNSILSATDPSSMVSVIGLGDIKLYANTTSNAYFIGISSFTSEGYLKMSTTTYNTYASTLSTVSSLFYDIPKTGIATSSLKNLISNISTGIEGQFNYFENYFITNYTSLNYYNINSTATGTVISNMNNEIDYLYIQLGTFDVVTIQNISTATGTNTRTLSTINNVFSTKLLQASSIAVNRTTADYTVDISGSLRATNIIGYPSQTQINSTVAGLGTIGYLSTAVGSNQLISTVSGLGSIGYVSTSINVFSTIPPLPNGVDLGALSGNNIILSSVSFKVDSMSTFFQKGAKGYIRISPTFSFDSNTGSKALINISTNIRVDTQILNNIYFNRAWIHANDTSANIYNDTINLELDNTTIMNNITSTFTVCHTFTQLNSAQSNYHLTSDKNACSIHLCSPY